MNASLPVFAPPLRANSHYRRRQIRALAHAMVASRHGHLQPDNRLEQANPDVVRTFVSVFLVVFVLGLVVFIIAPVVYLKQSSWQPYTPPLPLAQARAAEFLDAHSIPVKQQYLALTDAKDATGADQILIPSIHVQVPLALSASLEDKDVVQALQHGAALYPNGVLPGQLGNIFITAHSTGDPWQGNYRFAFLRANEVKPGDAIHLDYKGTRYTYKITHSRIIKPSPDFGVLSDRPVPTLTLMTCWPLWSTDSRLLIHAELTNITDLARSPA